MTWITTTDPQRLRQWRYIFQTDLLPVRYDEPRPQEVHGGAQWIYDLDLAALHEGQIMRLATHLSKKYRMSYNEIRTRIEADGTVPIVDRGDLKVVETADIRPSLPLPPVPDGRLTSYII